MASILKRYTASSISSTTDIGTLDLRYQSYLSYQVNVTGSLVGIMQLWLSNDGVNFVQKTDAAKSISSSGSYLIELASPAISRYYRFTMYVSSGSGSVDVVAMVKGDA